MRSKALIILTLVLSVAGTFLICFEELVRSHFGGPMTIAGLPISNASVTGEWYLDFLWTGKAWSIEVQSDEALELKLDGGTYVVPKGSHTVYSNHDNTNTGEFGTKEFWGYPKTVAIRPLDSRP